MNVVKLSQKGHVQGQKFLNMKKNEVLNFEPMEN